MTSTPQKPAASTNAQSRFVPADTKIGENWGNIVDFEFSPVPADGPRYLMAYHQEPHIYVVAMDPATGDLAGDVETNRKSVTDNAAPFWRSAFQGPEWGYNEKDGFSVFFAELVDGKSQIAYSKRTKSGSSDPGDLFGLGEWSEPVILTNSLEGRMGQTASRVGPSSTQVNYTRWDPRLRNSDVQQERMSDRVYYWMDVNERVEHKIPHVMMHTQPPHFFETPDHSAICDLVLGLKDKHGREQVVRYITREGVPDNQRAQFLTSGDRWDHWDPDCLPAFQRENDTGLVYVVKLVEGGNVYPTRIGIYDESPEGPYGSLVLRQILEIPKRALSPRYPTSITSLETISSPIGNQCFLSMRLETHNNPKPLECDSSVWLFSLDGKLQRQVSGFNADEGNFRCNDPEFMWGTDELFIYYNVYDPGSDNVDLHLCKTGVKVDGSYTAGPDGE